MLAKLADLANRRNVLRSFPALSTRKCREYIGLTGHVEQ